MIPSAPLGTDAAADRPGLGAAAGAPPQGGVAERRFRFELAARPGSVAQARRLTHARLTGWSVCADTCDNAALVISELVTNAVVHTASSRVVCELHEHGDTVRIAVHDEGCAPGEPHPSAQRPDEEHGRGLLLVDALCRAWGAQGHGPGLLVWAELAHRTDTAHDTAEPRGDLGWGARPKPGRPDDSGEEQQTEADEHGPERHRPGMPSGPDVQGRSRPHPQEQGQGVSEQHRLGEPEQYRHPTTGQPLHRAPEQYRHAPADGHPHVTGEQQHRQGRHPDQHRYAAPGRPLHHAPGQYRRGERP
ncbi:ATP-binding protein [Streptomyces dangxiongensis]|uniref:ATP-binding protein n=1 Tax=Streptomyces dangxiongensis TaxID=1442032 RepID=UPI0026C8B5B6